MTILAGDIGGTHVRLATAEKTDAFPGFSITHQQIFLSSGFDDFTSLLQLFLNETHARPDAACFAVAGPVSEGQAKVTNLPWQLDEASLAKQLADARVSLLNDFAAVAYGVSVLSAEELVPLQAGAPDPAGVRAVIGAGTGLGEAIIVPCESGPRVVSCENGHADLAPTDELEIALWHFLKHGRARVSNEDVLSGKGIALILEFLSDYKKTGISPELKGMLDGAEDSAKAALISQAALSGKDRLALQAMDLFLGIYGSRAGNLALTCLPRGGLYIAGGIAAKNLSLLQSGLFMARFVNKAPMRSVLDEIPVYVVTDELVGLKGAMQVAARL